MFDLIWVNIGVLFMWCAILTVLLVTSDGGI